MNKLLIIDGNALMHRAYHALPDFSANGTPTNAVYGFANALNSTINDLQPTHVAVCLDFPAPTFRDALFAEYRTQRPKTDNELVVQFPILKEFLSAAHIAHYELEGFEADDLIAAITHDAEERHFYTVILTGDKDIFQLATKQTMILTPSIGQYAKNKAYDPEEVTKKFGVGPELIADFKALVGDPSDNYKGVPGIGPKSAVDLIKEFGSVEEIYLHIERIRNDRVRKLLIKHEKEALLAKQLAILKFDIEEFEFNLDDTEFHSYNEELIAFFDHYQFRTLKRRYFPTAKLPDKKPKQTIDSEKDKEQLGLF